jgi:hypothetical protein
LVLFNLNQTGFINFQKINPCHFTSCEASHLYIHMSFYFCGSCVWVSITGIHTKFRVISFTWLLFSSLFHLQLFSMKHFECWNPKAILRWHHTIRVIYYFFWAIKMYFQLSRNVVFSSKVKEGICTWQFATLLQFDHVFSIAPNACWNIASKFALSHKKKRKGGVSVTLWPCHLH